MRPPRRRDGSSPVAASRYAEARLMPSILAACGTGSSSGSASKLFFFNLIYLLTVRPTVCTPPDPFKGWPGPQSMDGAYEKSHRRVHQDRYLWLEKPCKKIEFVDCPCRPRTSDDTAAAGLPCSGTARRCPICGTADANCFLCRDCAEKVSRGGLSSIRQRSRGVGWQVRRAPRRCRTVAHRAVRVGHVLHRSTHFV